MKKTTFRLRLCIVLLVMNLVFIWGNSLLPREVSASFSQWVKALLFSAADITATDPDAGHGLLRKIAHFTEFASLGFLLTWLCSMIKKPIPLAMLWGFIAACTDEIIQCFVPNRGPGILDVLIDTAGVCAGTAILCLCLFISKRNRKENTQ